MRGKLFGTVPERLLKREEGMAVGVISAESKVRDRTRQAIGRLIQVSVPQLNRNERLALFEEVEYKSRWNFDFASLMVLATAIASMGLLLDSGAVVIGAMLVAPLMMPLLGTGLSLAQGNWPLCRRALGSVVRGFLFALIIGLTMGALARYFELGMTGQLEARGKPNVLDLGVAFVSGVAAAYCVARPKLGGAMAGVAIAAALVPPIATVGISLVLGDLATSRGAAFLFGINVVAVVLGAALNFVLAGVRGGTAEGAWARRGLITLLLVCAGLVVPLTSILLFGSSRSSEIENVVKAELPKEARFISALRMDGGGYEVTVESDRPMNDFTKERLKEVLSKKAGKPVKVRLKTELVVE